uniref:Uncharacterized protein n=1 Tax=Setaria italica TaxID=4555 RepID=K4AHE3_SETIT
MGRQTTALGLPQKARLLFGCLKSCCVPLLSLWVRVDFLAASVGPQLCGVATHGWEPNTPYITQSKRASVTIFEYSTKSLMP